MANSHADDRDDGLRPNDGTCTYTYDSNNWLSQGGPEVNTTVCTYEYDAQFSQLHRHKPKVHVQLNDGTFTSLAAYLSDKTEPVVVLYESPIPPINDHLQNDRPKPGADPSDPESDVPTIIDRPRPPQ